MLLHVDTHTLEQHCDGCGARRRIALDSLVAGVEHGDRPLTPDVVALPQCPACGTRECLHRVAAPANARTTVSQHGRAVNAVHAALVSAGRVAPTLRTYFAEEQATTQSAELPWTHDGAPPTVRRAAPFVEFVRRSARSAS